MTSQLIALCDGVDFDGPPLPGVYLHDKPPISGRALGGKSSIDSLDHAELWPRPGLEAAP